MAFNILKIKKHNKLSFYLFGVAVFTPILFSVINGIYDRPTAGSTGAIIGGIIGSGIACFVPLARVKENIAFYLIMVVVCAVICASIFGLTGVALYDLLG